MPAEGVRMVDYFKGRGFDIKAANARLASAMDEAGLPFSRTREYLRNTRLAQELGKWGEQQGKRGIHDALFRAYFADDKDISKIDVLVPIAESVGLDGAEARRVLEERALKAAVDEDWRRARAVGVTGVPTYVAGRRGVVGAQPYNVLEELVRRAGAVKRRA